MQHRANLKRNLKQSGRPLDAFLTEVRLLIRNCGYPDKMQDEVIRDTLAFGTEHEVVRFEKNRTRFSAISSSDI